jgi:glutamate carboxypeptidase
MGELSSIEAAAVERARAAPMLEQVQGWSAINTGSRNLAGLTTLADLLAGELAALPGGLQLREPAPADQMRSDGALAPLDHGRNLHLKVRGDAPVQLLFTGHYDTVFAADHPFQQVFWRSDGVLGGPGVADMKGGIAVMLAALGAVEESPLARRIGYEVVLNSDEEVGSPGSAALIAPGARGSAAFTYEPSRCPTARCAGARPAAAISACSSRAAAPTPAATRGRPQRAGRRGPTLAAPAPARAPGSRSTRPDRRRRPNNVVPESMLRVNLPPSTPRSGAAQALLDA